MRTNDVLDYLAKMQATTDVSTEQVVEQAAQTEPVEQAPETPRPQQEQSVLEMPSEQWQEFSTPAETAYLAREYTPATPEVPSQTIVREANVGDDDYHPPVDSQAFMSKLEAAFRETADELARANASDLAWVKSQLEQQPENADSVDMRLRAQQ